MSLTSMQGACNFSLPCAAHGAEVVAVEENPYAVEDGRRNLELNGIKNCKIVKSSSEKYRINKKFDVIVLDPPRPGLTSEVVKKIMDNPSDSDRLRIVQPRDARQGPEKTEGKIRSAVGPSDRFFPQYLPYRIYLVSENTIMYSQLFPETCESLTGEWFVDSPDNLHPDNITEREDFP